jgi:hypothetical protein
MALRCVHPEIRYRHFPRENEGNWVREQPEHYQDAADDFEHSRKAVDGDWPESVELRNVRYVEQFRGSVLQVEKAHDEPQRAERSRSPAVEKDLIECHEWCLR